MTNYNDGNWHGWNGGKCPVHPETEVEAVCASVPGGFSRASWKLAGDIDWQGGIPSEVIAFRVVKPHREPKVWWRVGLHLHETKAEADQFLYRLRVDYPKGNFGPVVRVVEAEE